MQPSVRFFLFAAFSSILLSCGSKTGSAFVEDFEHGSKRGYAAGDVSLASGTWRLDGALIGKSAEDRKTGTAALRIGPGGSATMLFDVRVHVAAMSVALAPYGSDGSSQLSVWYSTNRGGSWQRLSEVTTTEGSGLQYESIPLPQISMPVRFSLRNEGAERLDADDVNLDGTANAPAAAPSVSAPENGKHPAGGDDNMLLGNPGNALASPTDRDNYLLQRPQYSLSYNNSRGIPNWVSWHLDAGSTGSTDRCNCFAPDKALPEGFFRAITSNYSGTGFDRGHLCPSADRSANAEDNAATFMMSNITPQAPLLNEQTWEHLESYCRKLTEHGMEMYIIAGCYGVGGSGRNGVTTTTIAGGHITVPAHFWKIILVLPDGANDLSRIDARTRVIAIDMPNTQDVAEHEWTYYRTTIAKIEAATGLHFLTALPDSVRNALRTKVESGLRSE